MAAATASLSFSRLLSSATKPHLTSASILPHNHRYLTSSFSPLRIKTLRPYNHPIKYSTTPKITATISVGDKLPDATFSYFDAEDDLQTATISDLTKSKKAILFAVPGAFTPTCSQKHLPGFVEKSGELKAKGVDTIACISVNDAFVMKAWKADLKIGDEVLLLSDGNGDFTRAIGCELDLSDKPVGLGVRSRRYAMLVEDGIVKVLNLEEGGAFTSSGADDMLKTL
ncbi:peroxiredoxin-2E-2, chloroplastic-like [Cynara cardunculus var. scolymus]|uniref:Glutaredoxin-dependent peroxiredoxin n=1 Tax=Cynara cardunculus var. scolymus TaxID=59895 RepID=A0A103YF44_CYNCS|nr:peroxiredoxin-2E-2, chloroplastic-like [Cynara cardunculus var. scolymus]KVI07946.1 Redoxin [Cynara cardunculus var. scolymus]